MELELKITGRTLKRVGLGALVAVAVAGVVFLGLFLFRRDTPLEAFVEDAGYQAVFLSDGRAYIGRLISDRGDYYVLEDVYYLQQAPPTGEENTQNTQQVLPRTGDLHGPTGRMLIPKEAAVLIENLRRDAELSRTIDRLRTEARD